ncbi:hypothetical protein C1646_665385 [Rhizophagus diaphanus]|nr:hypothetical protein C1646_665385 [Rhizophagus diaphanus] [Rhizophagus sp. MUCL 43196]
MTFECSHDVANDLEKLLGLEEGYDIIIYAGENENLQEIHAHSIILRVRSEYFHSAFSQKQYEIKDGKFVFRKPNISPILVKMILRFIYCGKINLKELEEYDILNLSIAVNEFNIQPLINYIQEYLIKHHDELLRKNPVGTLETIHQNNIFTDLLNSSFKKICEEPQILFDSDKFKNLSSPLLVSFLKSDDLLLDEIDIWENLIKWCLSQHSNISKDPTRWNNEDITIIERKIRGFIPLIRFFYITSENFVTRVYPFKRIMPEDLINKLLIFHMAPNKQLNEDIRPPRQSKCNIDSVIINHNHIKIFANWIYRKEKIFEYIPFKFNLLYRASRDGNEGAVFHEKCGDGATIVIVKVSDSEQIVGGYNPLSWHLNSSAVWKSTHDSFLFSFTDRNNLDSAKVGHSCGDAYSICCSNDNNYGPVFGHGIDLNLYKNVWYSDKSVSYPKLGIPKKFIADDYEVFEVIKK